MNIQTKVRIKTSDGIHDIILPLNQNELDQTLRDTGFYNFEGDNYKIVSAISGNQRLDVALRYAADIEELNYLTQILDHLDGEKMEFFNDIIGAEGETMPMIQIVNAAYNVYNDNFNLEPAITDLDDLGRAYAEGLDAATDEIIQGNIADDGEILYEGIGLDLQLSSGGVFTDSGYINNFDEMVNNPYTGKHFPPFFIINNTQLLGVNLFKNGDDKSTTISLPASDGVLRRTKERIGTRLSSCSFKPCWGFPLPLAQKTLPLSDLSRLNAIATRLSVLSAGQIKNVLEMSDHAEISAVQEFEDFCAEKIREIQKPEAVKTVAYYFPLDIKMNDNEGYDEEDEDYYPDYIEGISSSDAVHYADEIRDQLISENTFFETNRLLAEYLDEDSTLYDKVYSMLPAVEVHGNELWGAMVMKTTGELTPGEVAGLKDYITGQNSDGYGEGFEQREINVSGGEIYVSFWSNEKGYAVYTQDEFNEKIARRQTASGSPRPESRNSNELPDCPIIGADGNVYNLIGIVSRTLKDHGLPDQAEEMQKRVTSSGSYNEALAIMTEYINPVSADDIQQSGGFGMKM